MIHDEIFNKEKQAMPKITFMGAGSTVFAKNVLGDCMMTPALRDSHIALFDIDPQRLKDSENMLGFENLCIRSFISSKPVPGYFFAFLRYHWRCRLYAAGETAILKGCLPCLPESHFSCFQCLSGILG